MSLVGMGVPCPEVGVDTVLITDGGIKLPVLSPDPGQIPEIPVAQRFFPGPAAPAQRIPDYFVQALVLLLGAARSAASTALGTPHCPRPSLPRRHAS